MGLEYTLLYIFIGLGTEYVHTSHHTFWHPSLGGTPAYSIVGASAYAAQNVDLGYTGF